MRRGHLAATMDGGQQSPTGGSMKDDSEQIAQLRDYVFGVQSAVFAALGAIIRTHPDPTALAQMMDLYRQREQTYLENKAVPEHVLDSFHQAWNRFDVEIQQAHKDGQQRPQSLG